MVDKYMLTAFCDSMNKGYESWDFEVNQIAAYRMDLGTSDSLPRNFRDRKSYSNQACFLLTMTEFAWASSPSIWARTITSSASLSKASFE